MKLGSLFDGSGGFPLAGILCGIEPVWASEVEPYPIAVTKSRFPKMKHLGNICNINGAEIEPVDIITFGSPCQDLSVAGKRAGLKHEDNGDEETTRSGLFMEAVRIIKEMRKATGGKYPRYTLWENVPGAFSSSKGEDFRVVLEELIKIAEPNAVMPGVPKNGWAYADSYRGDGWSLAYRVFDAQYWGVPQRRRRIHLIADFRGGRAEEVLFKSEGLRGYSAESGEAWQGVAGDAPNCAEAADREGKASRLILDDQGGSQINVRTDGKAPTIRAEMHGNVPCVMEAAGFCTEHSAQSRGIGYEREVAPTLRAGVTPALVYSIGSPKCYDIGEARLRTPNEYVDKSPTLTARCGTGGNNVPAVVTEVCEGTPVYCLQGNGIDRADTAGCNGKGVKEDVCYTLNTIDRPAVAYAMQAFGKYAESDLASAMKARDYKDATDLVVEYGTEEPIAIDRAFYNQWQNAQYDPQYYTDGTVPTLVAKGPSAVCHKQEVRYIVRRLTPTECARLQGFPDKWGHPDSKSDFSDEEYRFWLDVRNTHAVVNGKEPKTYSREQILKWYNGLHTDSAEYKMWGNGIALPPALYCMLGMAEAMKKEEHNDKG